MKQEMPIISKDQTFYKEGLEKIVKWEIVANNTLDLPAIASFIAMGFMLDQDTYYNEIKTVRQATRFDLDDNNIITNKEQYRQWHYSPKDNTSSKILEEFTSLFEKFIQNF